MNSQSLILPDIILTNQNGLIELCQVHQVTKLWLIGSVLRPSDFRQDSDIDMVYELDHSKIDIENYSRNLWAFWDALESLFGRKVDLIHYPSIRNPYFKEEVDETRLLVYEQGNKKISV